MSKQGNETAQTAVTTHGGAANPVLSSQAIDGGLSREAGSDASDQSLTDADAKKGAESGTPARPNATAAVFVPIPEDQALPAPIEASAQTASSSVSAPSVAVNPASTVATAPSGPPILDMPASSPPAQPTASQTGDDAANTARVVRGLMSAVQQRGGMVTLRLQPPELGMVRVELQLREGAVQAAFMAERESARSLLQTQIGHLRHALESQGLLVERLNVQAMDAQSNSSGGQFAEQGGNDGRSRGAFTQHQGRQADSDDQRQGRRRMPSRFEQTLNAVA